MSESLLATALAWTRREHPVVPLHGAVPDKGGRFICSCRKGTACGASAAKHPLASLDGKSIAPNGLLSATIEPGVVKHWFGLLCPTANLGVVTDRLVVLDIDERHDGPPSLVALEREFGPLPATWRSRTGGGGEHVIFACPDGVEIQSWQARTDPKLGPGIDGRARGGYIVSPPSRHVSGRSYAWDVDHHPSETPLAEPPAWLIEKLAERHGESREATPPEEWARLTETAVTEYRDAAIARLAGHLFRRWVDPRLVPTLILAWNDRHCRPPLPEPEVLRIIDRIAERERQRRLREEAGDAAA